jgi:ATP-dependent DNA helicase RecG
MSSVLPIHVERLLHNEGIESVRVELKATWDPETTGPQVLETLCAFANDLQHLNGGYT